jgi:single-stranded DNA-binding protein
MSLANMNRVYLTGYIHTISPVFQTERKEPGVMATLSFSESFRKDNVESVKSYLVDIAFFGERAIRADAELSRGAKVFIEGALTSRISHDRLKVSIRVQELVVLKKGEKGITGRAAETGGDTADTGKEEERDREAEEDTKIYHYGTEVIPCKIAR